MNATYREPAPGEVEQTSILRDVTIPEVRGALGESVEVSVSTYPWMVVLTQDCDLRLDLLARAGQPAIEGGNPVAKDKILRSILLCPAFPCDHVLAGTYIEGGHRWAGTEKKILQSNREDRYHVLPIAKPIEESIVLDFKLVSAAPPEYVYVWLRANPKHSIAVLRPPFRDRLIQRFLNYVGRIALPDEG